MKSSINKYNLANFDGLCETILKIIDKETIMNNKEIEMNNKEIEMDNKEIRGQEPDIETSTISVRDKHNKLIEQRLQVIERDDKGLVAGFTTVYTRKFD